MEERDFAEMVGPTPARSTWGRWTAGVYLALVGAAFVLVLVELAQGTRGLGSVAVSVLTAPWSAALALLAQALPGSLGASVMRVVGFVLTAACAGLNARILYGVAARAERDVNQARGAR